MARRTRRLTGKVNAFWDASALVPLCTLQSNSAAVNALYRRYFISVWWGTSVEIASALAREHRMGSISATELIAAQSIARSMEQGWSEIIPAASLRANARDLVNSYALRAADALQLSAAIAWCEQQPAGRIFLTTDIRLREAARLYGFDTSYL